jgi:hypothetical protein
MVVSASRHWSETGFEEITARAAFRSTIFPLTGLLARDYFRLARDPGTIAELTGCSNLWFRERVRFEAATLRLTGAAITFRTK